MQRSSLPFALLLTLIVGCSSTASPSLPAVVPPAKIPGPPKVAEPLPSGMYWQTHCEMLQRLQQRLKATLTPTEPCVRLGLETEAK